MYDYIDDIMPKNFRVDFSEDNISSKGRTINTDSIRVYKEEGDYMLIFVIYLPNYWNERLDLVEQSPIISFYGLYVRQLNDMFGKLWYEPFKMWINHNIPEISDIDIKTFDKHF
jgi:hypothetical protein